MKCGNGGFRLRDFALCFYLLSGGAGRRDRGGIDAGYWNRIDGHLLGPAHYKRMDITCEREGHIRADVEAFQQITTRCSLFPRRQLWTQCRSGIKTLSWMKTQPVAHRCSGLRYFTSIRFLTYVITLPCAAQSMVSAQYGSTRGTNCCTVSRLPRLGA